MAFSELVHTGAIGPTYTTSTDGMLGAAPAAVKLNILTPYTVGDDGGWAIELSGIFPMHLRYLVEIIRDGEQFDPQLCYSGVVGQGSLCIPQDATKLKCFVPPLPIGDNYDIRVRTENGILGDVALNVLNIIHRSFATNLYSIRAHFPRPRSVGAYSPKDED